MWLSIQTGSRHPTCHGWSAARLLFNALVHQYLITGTQVGAKITVDPATGNILDVFAVSRPVTPDSGCLWCNGLIDPARLAEEGNDPDQVRRQRYIDEPDMPAPSVITLNAVAAAHAANDYLLATTGLLEDTEHDYQRFLPRSADVRFDTPRKDSHCPECGREGRFARGDDSRLPTRAPT